MVKETYIFRLDPEKMSYSEYKEKQVRGESFFVYLENGKRGLNTHANSNGKFCDFTDQEILDIVKEGVEFIVCCYPNQVQARFIDLYFEELPLLFVEWKHTTWHNVIQTTEPIENKSKRFVRDLFEDTDYLYFSCGRTRKKLAQALISGKV